MKRTFVMFLIITPILYVVAQNSITVEIVYPEYNTGRVYVALLDKHEEDLMDASSEITNNWCTVTCKDVIPGNFQES